MMSKFIFKVIRPFIFFLFTKLKFYRSFSQEGEDLIIDRILKTNNMKYKNLFYLDIGAGHPIKYSNTFYFYLRGSRGITVDAFKKNTDKHKVYRQNDITLNLLIGDKEEIVNYYNFDQSELNTMNEDRVIELKNYNIFYKSVVKIKKTDLKNFFDTLIQDYLNKINFLNLDIEGSETEILKRVDWKEFKPKIICVEIINNDINKIKNSEIYKILISEGYEIFSKLFNSVIFVKNLK